MKNLLLIMLVVAIIGVAGWYFKQKEVSSLAPSFELSENLPIDSGPSPTSAEAATLDTDKKSENSKEDFKSMAFKIIDRPIVFKDNLSVYSKKLAEEKIKEAIAAIKIEYDFIAAWYDLGAYRKLIGDYEGAIEAWNFIGLIRPKDYISYNNLGDLYAFELKDYEKGEQNFLKSINNDPNNINAYLQLTTLYEYAYQEKSKEAENILLLGIKANPLVPNLKIALAQYYERNGRKAEALRYFEEALSLNLNNQSLQQEVVRLKALIN